MAGSSTLIFKAVFRFRFLAIIPICIFSVLGLASLVIASMLYDKNAAQVSEAVQTIQLAAGDKLQFCYSIGFASAIACFATDIFTFSVTKR